MSSITKTKKTIEIFYSYSHKDQRLRDQLEIQLALLKRQGLISEWHDRKISAGKEWVDEIDEHLNTADIILLLVSPDFMASDYCYNIEVKRAMERHERGEARVIPIICRPVYWRGSAFGMLEPLPTNRRPITAPGWHNQDEAFFDVAEGIRKSVEELTTSKAKSQEQTGFNVRTTLHSIPSQQVDILKGAQKSRSPLGKQILVVDDEPAIQRILRRNLTAAGYEVLIAEDGKEAIDLVMVYKPDLILLDLNLPGELDGFDVCTQVRQWTEMPIVILSVASAEWSKIRAFDLGANDYLTKPWSNEELLARIRVLLRMQGRTKKAIETSHEIYYSNDGKLYLNVDIHQVHVGEQEVKLTQVEFELLKHLMMHAGKVLTHRFLLHAVWGPEYVNEADYLRVFMRQLRLKLEIDPKHPQYILTEPGVGYVFSSRHAVRDTSEV